MNETFTFFPSFSSSIRKIKNHDGIAREFSRSKGNVVEKLNISYVRASEGERDWYGTLGNPARLFLSLISDRKVRQVSMNGGFFGLIEFPR